MLAATAAHSLSAVAGLGTLKLKFRARKAPGAGSTAWRSNQYARANLPQSNGCRRWVWRSTINRMMESFRQSRFSRLCATVLMSILLAASVEAAHDKVHQHDRHPATAQAQHAGTDHDAPASGNCEHCWHIAGSALISSSAAADFPLTRNVEPRLEDLDFANLYLPPPTRPPIG